MTFNKDIIFNLNQLFYAKVIKILDLLELPVKINKLPNINNLPSLVGSADKELDKVKAQGVNIVINKVSKAISNSTILNKEGSQAAELTKVNLTPLTPYTILGRSI